MTKKVLMIDYAKCDGCGDCEIACSKIKEGVEDPAQSRIRIVKKEAENVFIPVTCQQCLDAPCLEWCPVTAISREPEMDRVIVDQKICIGCKTCVTVCPFGAMAFNKVSQQVMKCDLCDGDPECVKVCKPGALFYIDPTEQSIIKQVKVTGKYMDYFTSDNADFNQA